MTNPMTKLSSWKLLVLQTHYNAGNVRSILFYLFNFAKTSNIQDNVSA